MKTYYLLLIIFILSCIYSLEAQVKKESSPKRELGTVYKDSFPQPEVIEFKLGPKIPKETYLVNQKPYSLEADYGKEVISSITPKDGLPSINYRDLEFDKNGNIWLENNYLIKYDGNQFKEFEGIDMGIYTSNTFIDKNNHIWINGAEFYGDTIIFKTSVFDGIRLKEIKELALAIKKNKPKGFVSIYQGANNTIWALNTYAKKLIQYEGQAISKSYAIDNLSLGSQIEFQDLGDKGLFIFDRSNQNLVHLKNDKFNTIDLKTVLPNERIFSIFATDSNTYLATSRSGTYHIEDQNATFINNERRLFFSGSNNFIWSYNYESIKKKKDGIEIDFGIAADFNNSRFINVDKDNADHIWVGGQSFIGKFDETIKTYNDLIESDRKSESFRSIHQAKNGDFYLGSFSNGLIHYDGSSVAHYNFSTKQNEGRGVNNITSIIEDLEGNIWFGNIDGQLTKFDGEFFQSYTLDGFLVDIKHVDSRGNIWFYNSDNSLDAQFLYKFDGNRFLKIAAAVDIGARISCVFEDASGTTWIGNSQALWKYDKGSFTKYTTKDGLPNSFINTIQEDEEGNLWLGTDNGLSVFDGESFRNYGRSDGITEKIIGTIIKDSINDKFWIKGQWSDKLTAVQLDPVTRELHVEDYSAQQGFPFPSSYNMFVDQEGAVWLSLTNSRLARFDYQALKANSKPFPIHFNDIRINGESLVWSQLKDEYASDSLISKIEMISRFGKEKTKEELKALQETFGSISYDSLVPFDYIPTGLKLPYSANSLSFEFSAIDPFLAKSTQYQYYLEGIDKAWSPLGKNTIANYGNLFEGDYTLKVKALNPYGLWSDTDYKFVILPPWYRTWWAYAIYGVLLLLLLKQVHNYQKKRTIKKERAKAQERELEQAKEIEKAYNDLKATQQQLIQSEKMASLGELTAGIAHEIQNPLNFVNNFSEVSNELIDEMNEELDNGDIDEAKAISKDVKQNLEKITYHGQRADSIVKGMLQHSRNSSGEKESTDINKLTDEYMRLAYHGLRAKDKSFNATLETSFDEGLQPITIVTQEVGRVILNLFTNAFYAVNEKKHAHTNKDDTYKPSVTASTSSLKSDIIVKVRDNGNGIPKAALKKIFDPFFTTKPTGQGTGLGLSMSFDIIKSHGGQLNVNTKEGEFTEFVISLPIK